MYVQTDNEHKREREREDSKWVGFTTYGSVCLPCLLPIFCVFQFTKVSLFMECVQGACFC